MNKLSTRHAAAIAAATLAWTGIVLQFLFTVPALMDKGRTLGGAVVQLLSYFTILSNLMVAVLMTMAAIRRNRSTASASPATAIAVYITIVALVYNIVLRRLWHPTGWLRVSDELLHVINPLLYLIYWYKYIVKQHLHWRQIPRWLIFPFLYLIYILVRGAITGFYPYPFLDVSKFGYVTILLNSAVLLVVFSFFSALYIFVTRKR